MMKDGMNLSDIICEMYDRHKELVKTTTKLEAISPKRYRFSDGIEVVYQAPTNLIPVIELAGPSTSFKNFVKPARDILTRTWEDPHALSIIMVSMFKGWEHRDEVGGSEYHANPDAVLKKHLDRANLFFDYKEA